MCPQRRGRTKRPTSGTSIIPNRAVAKGVQLRLLRQRVAMAAQKNAQAEVLLHRLHYVLLPTGACFANVRVVAKWYYCQ